jgi:DNA-directed RNA polymerase subunit M/transcription elongation factor TFIIS
MVEFCEKCSGIMLPFKDVGENILICTSCANTKPIENDFFDSYIIYEEKNYPPGEES